MSTSSFHDYYDTALQALGEQRLGDALQALNNLLAVYPAPQVSAELQTINDGYRYLLEYMLTGQADPSREQMFRSFIRSTYDVIDDVFRLHEMNGSSHFATTAQVIKQMRPGTSLQSRLEGNPSYQTIFESVWTSAKWTADDEATAQSYMQADETDEVKQCIFVSAATLGLLHHFDIAKFRFLGDTMHHSNVMVSVRAICGFILAAYHYKNRLYLLPDIEAQALEFFSSPRNTEMLRDVQAQFFMLNESEGIAQKMRDDIMPQMMEKIKEYKQKGIFSPDSMNDVLMEQSLDPALFVNDDLGKKIKQLIERQSQGADLYLNTFSMMKQNFPFFNTAANWFCPFTNEHPDIKQRNNDKLFGIVNNLAQSNPLCNSDRYSFFFMMDSLSSNMLQSLGPLYEQMMQVQEKVEATATKFEKNERTDRALQLRFYMQDLFRFFKYFRYRDERISPFKTAVNLLDVRLFNEEMLTQEDLHYLSEFAFATKVYDVAVIYYEKSEEHTPIYWQKLGYCHQMLSAYEEAIECYRKSALSSPPSQWMLRQMAECHRHLLQWNEMLEVYQQLLKTDDENTTYLMREAECYVMLKQPEEAAKLLSKVYYLDENHHTAIRALAWCKMLTHKPEDAAALYQKLLDTPAAIADDFYNAGHAALVLGHFNEAVGYYRQYLRQTNQTYADTRFFDADMQILAEYSMTDWKLQLVRDALNRV